MSLEQLKSDCLYWCRLLNEKGFVTARSGNVSCKAGGRRILITAHDSYLGHPSPEDLVLMDEAGTVLEGSSPSSERAMHLAIHKEFEDVQVVLHTHSPATVAFFHYFDSLDIFSFEAKFYLGVVPVLGQETPTVTDVTPVLTALKHTAVVVLKDHGVVAVGKDFKAAFSLIELLEEQAKVNLLMKSPGQRASGPAPEKEKKTELTGKLKKYTMLSKEHAERLREIVNTDARAQELGKKYGLTCTLAVKNQETGDVMRFCYEQGRITSIDTVEDAEFIIIGKGDILKNVFNRQIDPFVAQTQGKVKTKGDFAKMSKWYPVMVHTFALWEKAPVE